MTWTMAMLAAVAALIAAPAPAQPRAAGGPTVQIDSGALSGAADGRVERFLGIPFAAPPTGPLRWRAPQPAARWTGVRPATRYGADCMQEPYPSDAAPLGTTPSEDCLTVNVWRPAGARAGAKLPVLVWIYGGGSVNGGASPAIYSGDAFARDGVVMVSYNWRVGRFGFFAFPALTEANADGGLLANYGYMDSVAALRWVRRNIAAFGGDPAAVTIYGQSAGAAQVAMLLTSPEAHGLFQRAILQSGNPTARPTLAEGERTGVAFARRWGIDGTDAAALARLRALTPAQVTDGIHIGTMANQRGTFAGPMIDGRLLTGLLPDVTATARQARVPLIIGSTTGDNYALTAGKSLDQVLHDSFAGQEGRARIAYGIGEGAGAAERALHEMGRDLAYNEASRFVAGQFARQGVPAYVYLFGYVAETMRGEWRDGPPHATDIPFAMDTLRAKYGDRLTATDQAAARTLHDYWVHFVKTGDPNGAGMPAWPRYAADTRRILLLGADGSARSTVDPYAARLDVVAAARGR